MTNIRSLDGLRGLLALAVFIAHLYMGFIRPANGIEVTAAHEIVTAGARLAVVFFFVLSGFVITMSLDQNRRSGLRISEFAIARAARILPPLLATMAITAAIGIALLYAGYFFVTLDSAERMTYYTEAMAQLLAIASLTLRGDLLGRGFNGPLWSLVIEIRLYVAAGLVAVAAWHRSPAARIGALALLGLWVWAVQNATPSPHDLRLWTMSACFAAGAIAYWWQGARTQTLALATIICACAAAVTGWLAASQAPSLLIDYTVLWAAYQALAACAFAAVMLLLARTDRLACIAWLGASSYTVYILHFPVQQACFFVLYNVDRKWGYEPWNWVSAAVAGLVSFAVCVAVAKHVERPKAQRAWLGAKVEAVRSAFRLPHPHSVDTAV